jgi:hypothetical protein
MEKKIIDYVLIREYFSKISDVVCQHIANGYVPIGNICFDGDYHYCQAMVKYES